MVRLVVSVVVLVLLATACGGEDLGGELMAADVDVIMPAAAEAMGAVTSVKFELVRSGARVYIDPVESLSLSEVVGRYSAPSSADALLTVEVNDSLKTKLGAIAIDGETWLSNPVTGDFEPLPPGYDIDPRMFFDPRGGWQPLLEELIEIEMIGTEQRDGTRFHLTALAPASRIQTVTAGLVRQQDVAIDLWLHPVSGLVTAVEFSTVFEGETTDWVLELTDYGDDFVIEPPELR